jgi:signal transduction histidine kinase
MDFAFFEQLRAYVGLAAEEERELAALAAGLPDVLDELVEDFYGAILRDDAAKRVLDSDAQLQRLKQSLRDWARTMVAGPHDERWVERRARIGHRHVEVGLPPRFVPLAIARIRPILTRLALRVAGGEPGRLARLLGALHKVLDLELAIMLETYHELHHARVRKAEQLGALGQLAASVSHELKNPLGVINTSLHLLRGELAAGGAPASPTIATHLDRIGRGSRQAARLASQLLDFAHGKQPQPRRFALAMLLDDALAMVEERDGVVVETRCDPPDATAHADPAQLARALANLVRNAVQAIRESGVGGVVQLRARRDPLGVVLVVADDGPGIAPEERERAFEPLATTRPDGTGLGLAITRDLIEAHGGRISVSSNPGQGAVFTVLLPQASGPT